MGIRVLLDWIYPRRCPLCDDIVLPRGELVCRTCKEKQPFIAEPYCMCCGKPMKQMEKEYCSDCEKMVFSFERCFSLWVYDEKMKQSIKGFKYQGRKEYAAFYAEQCVRRFMSDFRRIGIELLVPVPIHRERYQKRGYNQAALLAQEVGKLLHIKVESNFLIRTKRTVAQKELTRRERATNLQSAFEINPACKSAKEKYHTILLVDDIYTTGSTAHACASLLKRQAKKVYVLCLCVGNVL